MDKLISV